MIVTYDRQEDAAYIYLAGKHAGAARTVEVSADIILDFDCEGHLIGIELLKGALLHPDLMARAIVPGEAVAFSAEIQRLRALDYDFGPDAIAEVLKLRHGDDGEK
ncbi:MAG TPA: DUF2283 domain-containing protein [Xanthobacteraceae bacterium]|nr:DUF2283 domain-containing protein [Xanthobacteraceae bacterium]